MSICATASRALGEPLAGTAATARTWLLIEQPGPWGAKALTSSRLDPALGRRLEEAARDTGVRLGLIRRPGRTPPTPARRVFAAHVVPGQGWVHEASIASDEAAERLLGLDLKALGAGDATSFLDPADGLAGTPYTGAPLVCVCANGKRDRCCALLGRPLAAELHAAGTEGVWEVTHLGGHRFSPTLLVLPYGYAYGRADAALARTAQRAAASGRVHLDGCRGRSVWERPEQAAELAVRAETGEERAEALTLHTLPPGEGSAAHLVRVDHGDGRRWTAEVVRTVAEDARPESCGAAPARTAGFEVVRLTAQASSR
ncbi:sucrase ferredoxin [Streptomyces sp. NPDC004959]|uniref:sucrase ferredoxin n=1 Tax=unclassified Streptomyces TaxID=2593676 RepID=UPI0004CAD03B|nr:sucrase ferredoxin [Streptomyces sp. NRRL F-5630]